MKGKIIKDALILLAITVIAGVGLGAVYNITKEPIAKVEYDTQQNAYRTVFKDAAEFVDLPGFSADDATKIAEESGVIEAGAVTIDGCVQAVGSDGTLLGYVITVTPHNGYSGDITFSLGVQLDGTLNGYSITSISETAGLGMKAQEEAFYSLRVKLATDFSALNNVLVIKNYNQEEQLKIEEEAIGNDK